MAAHQLLLSVMRSRDNSERSVHSFDIVAPQLLNLSSADDCLQLLPVVLCLAVYHVGNVAIVRMSKVAPIKSTPITSQRLLITSFAPYATV